MFVRVHRQRCTALHFYHSIFNTFPWYLRWTLAEESLGDFYIDENRVTFMIPRPRLALVQANITEALKRKNPRKSHSERRAA